VFAVGGDRSVKWRAAKAEFARLLAMSALLQACAAPRTVPATKCDASPMNFKLASVAPAAGSGPVWMVDGSFGCWHDGQPVKTLWIVDRRYAGSLEVRGEEVSGAGVVNFQSEEVASSRLLIANASRTGVIPGGASAAEQAGYAFHSSSVLYPHPGCWRLTASLGGRATEIVVRQVLCNSSGPGPR